jgi:hypothetical protein
MRGSTEELLEKGESFEAVDVDGETPLLFSLLSPAASRLLGSELLNNKDPSSLIMVAHHPIALR